MRKLRRAILVVVMLALVLASTSVTQAQEQTHVVQPGETLYRIAVRYGLTVEQLAAANGITNPALIFAGQVLIIPGGGGTTPVPTSTGTGSYTVVAGDTLYGIARRFDTSVDTLVRLNGLANANVLYVGQVLIVPVPGTPAPTDTPSPEPTVEATPTPEPDGPVIHIVQAGETLSHIALRYDITYQEIAILNGLDNPNLIYPGQELIIREESVPTPEPTDEPTEEPTDTPEPTEEPTDEPEPPEEPTDEPEPPEEPTDEPEPTEESTDTPEPTATATPTATSTPTSTPTATVTPTSTPTPTRDPDAIDTPTPIVPDIEVPEGAPNLLINPSFEDGVRVVGFDNELVSEGWLPFYCDQPYIADKCAALRWGFGNPEGLLMIRPGYNETNEDARVYEGELAQQWSCHYGACRGGVFQTVDTTPGDFCEAGAYVQTWSTHSTDLTSDVATGADRDNSTWFIRVDLAGGTAAFETSDSRLLSRGFSYDDGHFDQYAKISYTFTATSDQTTVYFENLRLWPFNRNVSYLDSAYVRCVTP